MNCLTEQELDQIVHQGTTVSDETNDHLQTCTSCSERLSEVKANLGFETDLLKMAKQDDGIEMKPDPDRKITAGKSGKAIAPEFAGDRYEPLDMIGKGGMGAVYVTRDRNLRRDVAIKTMLYASDISDPKAQRFMEEAQVTGQLEHPNIVPIHELGEDNDGNLYFTMKFVRGRSLAQILTDMVRGSETADAKQEASAVPSQTELFSIFLKVCDAIAFAHSKGVIHRDLKPDNVMIGDFGEVLVMDWGLAKVSDVDHTLPAADTEVEHEIRSADTVNADKSPVAELKEKKVSSVRSDSNVVETADGTVQGTPAYMSPEQAEGHNNKIDHRSDIYALGAILYEILTLKPPVEGNALHIILLRVADGNITPPDTRAPERNIPKELSAVCMKAMSKSRRHRYQSVSELKDDILLYLDGRAVSAKEDNSIESLAKLIRRNKGVTASLGLAAVVVVMLTLGFMFQLKKEKDRVIEAHAHVEQERDRVQEERDRAITAEKKQWQTALLASKRLALQAVRSAERNQMPEARRRAEDAEVVAPGGPWGLFAKGSVASTKGDFETGAKLLREALEKPDGQQQEIEIALANAVTHLGAAEEATHLLTELDDVKDWRALLQSGSSLVAAKNWEDGKKLLERAVPLMKQEKDISELKVAQVGWLLESIPAQQACEGFLDEVRRMNPREQLARVREKYIEINGEKADFNASLGPLPWHDISLNGGDGTRKHLYPFAGMPIKKFVIYDTAVWDISPLRGMPLTHLDVHQSPVSDLTPIKDCPLESLDVSRTYVTDLSPVRGMRSLRELNVSQSSIADVTPLAGLQLTSLGLSVSKVRDISAIRGMPLTYLSLPSEVTNLNALAGMKLKSLYAAATQARDISALIGMPLESFVANHAKIRDFSPLADLPLKFVFVSNTMLSDLTIFKNSPVQTLYISGTRVTDLSPLEGTAVRNIRLIGCAIRDYSPLTKLRIDRENSPWVPYLTGQITVEEFEQQLERYSVHAAGRNYGWIKSNIPVAVAAYSAMKLFAEEEYQASAEELKKAYAGKIHAIAHSLWVLKGALMKEGAKFE